MYDSFRANQPLLSHSASPQRLRNAKRLLILVIVLSFLLASFITSFAYYYVKYRQLQKKTQPSPDWQRGYISKQLLQTFPLNAVAADASVCSTIGSYVLNTLGGNAMDAAVASMFCIGVCNAHSAGIGGGSFLLYYNSKTRSASAFDFRESAAAAAKYDMFNKLALNASEFGGLAIAVPGEVAGLSAAHSKFGRLQWRDVVMPVVKLLRSGLHVAKPLSDAMKLTYDKVPDTTAFNNLKSWMINPATKQIYEFGDLLKDETLAATMEKISEDPFSFYNGTLAEQIVNEITDAGGIITLEDLRRFTVAQPEPINATLPFAKLQLLSLPPPSSGAVLAFILKIIDGFRPTPEAKNSLPNYVTFLHRMVEAMKFAFAKRSALGDPDFVNVTELVANLTSDTFADEIRAKISDDKTHGVNYYGPSFEWNPDSGTTHLSLVDSDGNAVAITSTINTYFGSLVRGRQTGILYNNEMDDFSVPNRTNAFGLPPSTSNFIEAGKRPMSSMAPAILTDSDGNIEIIAGGAGGTLITTAVAYTVARQIFLNETVKQATDVFRLHHQLVPDEIAFNFELDVIPQEIQDGLAAKGHKLKPTDDKSVIETIARSHSTPAGWQVSGDFRKPSLPSGN